MLEFSVLNNYNYENKSTFFRHLDKLSSPYRRLFGGRDVDVLNRSVMMSRMSTTRKVVIVMLSIVLFPAALVSLTSLLIKSIAYRGEKEKIQSQFDISNKFFRDFHEQCGRKDFDLAYKTIKERPQLIKLDSAAENLEELIHYKIKQKTAFVEIPELIRLAKTDKILKLIQDAIEGQFQCQLLALSGDEIFQFICQSLPYFSEKNIQLCVKTICEEVLTIKETDEILLIANKLTLAHELLGSFFAMKTYSPDYSFDPDQRKMFRIVQSFTLTKSAPMYQSIFEDREDMNQIQLCLARLRTIDLLIADINLTSFNKGSFDVICQKLQGFANEAKQFVFVSQNEHACVSAFSHMCTLSVQLIQEVKSNPHLSIEKSDTFQKIEQCLQQQDTCFNNFVKEKIPTENLPQIKFTLKWYEQEFLLKFAKDLRKKMLDL